MIKLMELTAKKLFEKGLKPAYLTDKSKKAYEELAAMYPYTQLDDESGTMKMRLFFQRPEQKKEFEQNGLAKPGAKLPYCEEAMGLALGYPPVAVKDYLGGIPQYAKIGIGYHGVYFVVHREHVKEALDFMEKTMPVPLWMKLVYRSKITYRRRGWIEISKKDL